MAKYMLLYFVICSILTVAILAPYSFAITHVLPNTVDPLLYAWNLQHNFDAALNGFKNLLDTNIFYPETNTLALSDTLFFQTILTAPILALTHNPVLAENVYILLTFPMSAVSMFLLCLSLTKNKLASGFAGVMYAFSYPRIAQIGHLPALSSQWLPLFFLSLLSYLDSGKWRHLLLSFFWFLFSITSTIYFGIFLIPLGGFLTMIRMFGQHKIVVWQRIRGMILLIIPALIVLTIVLFPYIRLRAEYPGIKRSLDDSVKLSATLTDYISVLPTSWLADIGFPKNTNERSLFPTLTLAVLAAASLFVTYKKNKAIVVIFLIIAIGSAILSLGPFWGPTKLPYYYLYHAIPLFQSVRVPARWSIFVILGLAASASYTITWLLQKKRYIPTLLMLLLFTLEIWQSGTPSVPIPVGSSIPEVYMFINKAPKGTIIAELPLIPEWDGVRMEDQLFLDYHITLEKDVYALEAYRTYFSSFHKASMINGYSGYFPNVYHDNSIALSGFPDYSAMTTLEKLRVRYILVHSAQYETQRFKEIDKSIKKIPRLRLIEQFGTDYVYEIQ